MDYFIHVAVVICLYVILGVSFNLLMGYSGLFSVAHAAFYGIGAYVSAMMALRVGLNFLAAMAIGIILTALVGALVAIPALRVSGDYLVIASFGFQMVVFGVMLNWRSFTNGESGLTGIPRPAVAGLNINNPAAYLPLVIFFALLCLAVAWRLANSPFGRVLKAIREDEVAAQSLGKDIVRFKILIFAITAGMAAVAGSLYAHYVTFINPFSFTLEESIFILAVVIVGGAGSVRGSVVGAVVLVIMPEALRFLRVPDSIAGPSRQILYGLLLILFMRFRPQGLAGEYEAAGRLEKAPAAGEAPAEEVPAKAAG